MPGEQKMTDQAVVLTWMAGPMPKRAEDGWWEDVPAAAAAFRSGWWECTGDPAEPIRPRNLSLDALHLVEAKLSDVQWRYYLSLLLDPYAGDDREWQFAQFLTHATAEQKIKALASVLRPVVEGK